jgi:hypothetical protein
MIDWSSFDLTVPASVQTPDLSPVPLDRLLGGWDCLGWLREHYAHGCGSTPMGQVAAMGVVNRLWKPADSQRSAYRNQRVAWRSVLGAAFKDTHDQSREWVSGISDKLWSNVVHLEFVGLATFLHERLPLTPCPDHGITGCAAGATAMDRDVLQSVLRMAWLREEGTGSGRDEALYMQGLLDSALAWTSTTLRRGAREVYRNRSLLMPDTRLISFVSWRASS